MPAGATEKDPRFFSSASAFRKWLASNHAKAPFLWIGMWKTHTGKKGLTYPQAVDEALCFGWIDGLRKRFDDEAFVQRFTPRRPGSIWSAINLAKIAALEKAGLMAPAGRAIHAARDPRRAGVYSFETRGEIVLDAALEKRFRADRKAWKFFGAQPPGYRRLAYFWVMRAKQPQTRARRLERLIADSALGQRLGAVTGKDPA